MFCLFYMYVVYELIVFYYDLEWLQKINSNLMGDLKDDNL